MRAWIETSIISFMIKPSSVARRVRAWIETHRDTHWGDQIGSHAVCVRGLKRKKFV